MKQIVSDKSLFYNQEMPGAKRYGWILKEATHEFREEVLDHALKHRAAMPRTALRYAIKKLPKEMRNEVMKR